jgi:hypothetical protein
VDGPWDHAPVSSSERPPAPGPLERPPQGLLGAPKGKALLPRLRPARSPGRHPAEDPRALHLVGTPPRGNPAAPSPEGDARSPSREASPPHPPRREQHRSPSPGHPRRSSSEEHLGGPPGARRHGPSSEVPRRWLPWEGPPRHGSSEPRQETSPEQAHRRCHRGASRQRPLGASTTPGTPASGPPGRLLLGGSTPSPSPRGFTATPSSEGAAPEPLTGSFPSLSLLGESGEGHPQGMQTWQPLFGEATMDRTPPKPHPRQAPRSPPREGLHRAHLLPARRSVTLLAVPRNLFLGLASGALAPETSSEALWNLGSSESNSWSGFSEPPLEDLSRAGQ